MTEFRKGDRVSVEAEVTEVRNFGLVDIRLDGLNDVRTLVGSHLTLIARKKIEVGDVIPWAEAKTLPNHSAVVNDVETRGNPRVWTVIHGELWRHNGISPTDVLKCDGVPSTFRVVHVASR